MITARYIRQDNITFRASHSLFTTTNYVPVVSETDHGTWRRLALLRFPYTFRKPGEELQAGTTTGRATRRSRAGSSGTRAPARRDRDVGGRGRDPVVRRPGAALKPTADRGRHPGLADRRGPDPGLLGRAADA